jgi:hypothetical protein
MSNERNLEHSEWAGNLPKMCLQVPNSRSAFQIVGLRMPGGLSHRLFASWWTWRQEQEETFIAFAPYEGEITHPGLSRWINCI